MVILKMPGKIWVKVHGARDLPVMDKSADTTDAFVEIRGPSSNVVYKTDVCPKTLHPRWETDWLIFEAEDHEIQDESLVFKSETSLNSSPVIPVWRIP